MERSASFYNHQGRMSWEDQMASNALRDVELQTDLWERRIKTWDTQLDMDVEARPREYRAANKQLT